MQLFYIIYKNYLVGSKAELTLWLPLFILTKQKICSNIVPLTGAVLSQLNTHCRFERKNESPLSLKTAKIHHENRFESFACPQAKRRGIPH